MTSLIPGSIYSYEDEWYMATTESNVVIYANGVEVDSSVDSFLLKEVRLYTCKELKTRWGVTDAVLDKLGEKIFDRSVINKRIKSADIMKVYKTVINERLLG